MNQETIKLLIEKALEARLKAYTPYSHFQVGAALLDVDDNIHLGCNIESASYTPTSCAERTAIFKAVSEGILRFKAIAVVGSMEGNEITQYAYPCGVCRQVMREFADPEQFLVIVAKSVEEYEIYKLKELLPKGFGPENLLD